MDIEKLIEQLNGYFEGKDLKRGVALDAATALSALQAENEKLRAELENYRKGHCAEGGCAAEKDRDAVLAELEQARAEITRLKHYEDKCHDCPIVCAKTEIIKAYEELEAAQNERDMWKEGMEDCQQSILELEAELEQVKRDFDGICEYIDSEGFLRKQFCENGNPDLEPCICPSLQEHPGYIDSDDCEGCDHFCNSWCGQKEDWH